MTAYDLMVGEVYPEEIAEELERPPIDAWHQKDQRSRSRRICTECQATIERGESYRRINVFCNHEWLTWSWCRACRELADLFFAASGWPVHEGLAAAVAGAREAGLDVPTPQEHRRQWEAAGSGSTQEGTPS